MPRRVREGETCTTGLGRGNMSVRIREDPHALGVGGWLDQVRLAIL